MGRHWKHVAAFVWMLALTFCSGSSEIRESIEWRFHRILYDYKAYGSVTLERIDIPQHAILVNLSSRVESSSSSCPEKTVKIFASQSGIPVVSRYGESFPDKMYVTKSAAANISVTSNNETVVWTVDKLSIGQLFLLAVMPKPDTRIKQKGLGEECYYYLNTQATVLYRSDCDVYQLGWDQSIPIQLTLGQPSLFSLLVPVETESFTIDVNGCQEAVCPVNVSIWETVSEAKISDSDTKTSDSDTCRWINGSCRIQVKSPSVDRMYYLYMSSNDNINLTIWMTSAFCNYNTTELDLPRPNSTFDCLFVGSLGRQTLKQEIEGSNLYDHFTTWDKNALPAAAVDLKLPESKVVVSRFQLRSSDTGTSLKVSLHLQLEKVNKPAAGSLTNVTLCLSANHLYHPDNCHAGTEVRVTSLKGVNKDYVIIPYPASGHWFVSLLGVCYQTGTNHSKEIIIPCKSEPSVNMSIHLSPCVDGRCGDYGVCRFYIEADLVFSACDCFSGWRGYGCNDGSQALSPFIERLAVYLLTLSNLGFLPGICLAVHRKFYVEALVYAYNMFFSTFYHACDTSPIYQLCIMPYNALSFADFFASLLSFWVTLMAMARIPASWRTFLHMLSALFISLGEVYNRHGLVEQLLPIAGGVSIVLVSWSLESYKRKSLFPSKRRLLKFILPGVTLSCLGLIFNLALETDNNYKYIHSLWHMLESFSILFLLPPRRDKLDNLSVQSGDITRSSALEFQANFQHADDINNSVNGSAALLEPSSPEASHNSRPGRGFRLLNRHSARRNSQNLIL